MNKQKQEKQNILNRRDFLKISGMTAGAALVNPWQFPNLFNDFPVSEKLGRIAVGMVDIKIRPDYESPNVGTYYEDTVVPWVREVVGPWPYRNNQRWIETPDGYIWAPNVQPVKNMPNAPIQEIPDGR